MRGDREEVPVTIRFLGVPEFADRIGVHRGTMNRLALPEPDAIIGDRRGWLPQTIDEWDAQRTRRRVPMKPRTPEYS